MDKRKKCKKNKQAHPEETYETIENKIKMLEYFQGEWLYRHELFWKNGLKLFIFNLVVTMLPFITTAFGVQIQSDKYPQILFPVLGIGIAKFNYKCMQDEAEKLSAVGNAKYRIADSLPKLFQYYKYVDNMQDRKKKSALSIPKYLYVFQIITCIVTICVIAFPFVVKLKNCLSTP